MRPRGSGSGKPGTPKSQMRKLRTSRSKPVLVPERRMRRKKRKKKEIDLTPGALSRTDDPVRLYLKEMGSVALLSREGEIEIAKRIEEGKKDIASVIYGMPMTIEFVLALYDQLKNGSIDVREIVPIVETEEEFEEEQLQQGYEELRVKTLEGLNSVRKISTSLKSLYEVARHANSDPAKQKKIKKQIDTIRDQVVEKMESVNLHGVLKDRMVQRVRELAIQIRTGSERSSAASAGLGSAVRPASKPSRSSAAIGKPSSP